MDVVKQSVWIVWVEPDAQDADDAIVAVCATESEATRGAVWLKAIAAAAHAVPCVRRDVAGDFDRRRAQLRRLEQMSPAPMSANEIWGVGVAELVAGTIGPFPRADEAVEYFDYRTGEWGD